MSVHVCSIHGTKYRRQHNRAYAYASSLIERTARRQRLPSSSSSSLAFHGTILSQDRKTTESLRELSTSSWLAVPNLLLSTSSSLSIIRLETHVARLISGSIVQFRNGILQPSSFGNPKQDSKHLERYRKRNQSDIKHHHNTTNHIYSQWRYGLIIKNIRGRPSFLLYSCTLAASPISNFWVTIDTCTNQQTNQPHSPLYLKLPFPSRSLPPFSYC